MDNWIYVIWFDSTVEVTYPCICSMTEMLTVIRITLHLHKWFHLQWKVDITQMLIIF